MSQLSLHKLAVETLEIPGTEPWHAEPSAPAVTVMTDFRERASVTIAETVTIDAALLHMRHAGVRSAFVIDDQHQRVVGLITAYDITSEKPLLVAHTPRSHVLVRDIMQRIADWSVVDFADLERHTVANVARLFKDAGLTHIPVMQTNAHGQRALRGLLSAARVKKLLAG
jgi:CBS domain containing-hemolysin-like protein